MDDKNLTNLINNEAAVLRYLAEITKQQVPLIISSDESETGTDKEFRSSILKIEEDKKQIILHQLLPGDWQDTIKPNQNIDITCHMKHGVIGFSGQLAPLDNSDASIYCRLSLPKQLSKKQLRDSFRVSLKQYSSKTSIEFEEGNEIVGTCQDISQFGALFQLPISEKLKQGRLIEHCHLMITDILNLSCPARVCHVANSDANNMLVGVNFLNLGFSQLNAIKPAMNKLERLNIHKQMA